MKKMIIDLTKQSRQEKYKLLIGSILPRPIAFVTSVDQNGIANAAPFSFFNIVSAEPPLLMFSCQRKANGVMKDTARNIALTQEFIVHVVDEENVDQVNLTSIDAPPEVNELELAGLTVVSGEKVKVPRVLETKIAMECKLYQHLEIGREDKGQPTSDVLIGEVICIHIQDDLYQDGKVLTERLRPVSRLAGLYYGTIGSVFERPRPVYGEWMKGK